MFRNLFRTSRGRAGRAGACPPSQPKRSSWSSDYIMVWTASITPFPAPIRNSSLISSRSGRRACPRSFLFHSTAFTLKAFPAPIRNSGLISSRSGRRACPPSFYLRFTFTNRHMRCSLSLNALRTFITQRGQIQTTHQVLSITQQHRHNRQP